MFEYKLQTIGWYCNANILIIVARFKPNYNCLVKSIDEEYS